MLLLLLSMVYDKIYMTFILQTFFYILYVHLLCGIIDMCKATLFLTSTLIQINPSEKRFLFTPFEQGSFFLFFCLLENFSEI